MSEGDDQLAQERALRSLAAGERRRLQSRHARPDRRQRPLGKSQVAAVTLQFALDDEVEQAVEVGLGLDGQADPAAHLLVLDIRARAVSSLRCRPATTTSASTYWPVRRASSRDSRPRAMNSA